MANEIISYLEMCQREGVSLQRGMNFGLGGNHSVILMSVRPNAPYEDEIQDNGTVLVYEGHDEPRSSRIADPKRVDQPEHTPSGGLTQNGLFWQAPRTPKPACNLLNASGFTRNCDKAFGPIMESSTSSMHGNRKATSDKYSSSNSLL